MLQKEIVKNFFIEGYVNHNYDYVLGFRFKDGVIVESWGYWPDMYIEYLLEEA